MSDQQPGPEATLPEGVAELRERDARLNAWLATVEPGDIVTVRLNRTDVLTGKVYEAPDARGTSLCVNTTVLRFGNGYPGPSYEPVAARTAHQSATLAAVEADVPRTNGGVWADHGHPLTPCSPPEAVRGGRPCRLRAPFAATPDGHQHEAAGGDS